MWYPSKYLICVSGVQCLVALFPRFHHIMSWLLTEHKVLNEIMFTHTQAGAFWASIKSQYTWNTCSIFLDFFLFCYQQQHDIVSTPNSFIKHIDRCEYILLPHIYAIDPVMSVYWKSQIYILIEIQSTCCNFTSMLFRFMFFFTI